ncbi:MAG: hypothetical protein DRP74_03575 [Candidatus Omnitrophota bacterium]|nr:MAG: hypothetical protein DRP74_03575 [Candidatus Omnitrophota bacterium]
MRQKMLNFFRIIFKNYSLREAVRAEIEEDLGFLVRGLPGVFGFLIRYLIYKLLFKKIESIPYIFPGVRFVYMSRIHLSKNVLINSNTYIYGRGGIEIGDNVLISPGCSIVAGDHSTKLSQPIIEQPSQSEKIVIGRDSWIGANSVILGGIAIGEGSVIGAGSVVTHDTEPYSVNLGSPARKTGERRRK